MGMIPWGKVVDAWKETAALWGKINGSWQVLEENLGTPFNEALALVGIDKVDSLSVVLTNSDYCTALAGNTEAVEIMKANYSADMTSAIDSNWNEGLNTLNYKCKLKTYLFRNGNTCVGVTGGWDGTVTDTPYGGTEIKGVIKDNQLNTLFDHEGTKGVAYLRTTNAINRDGYSKIGLKASVSTHPEYSYDSSTSISTAYDDIVGSSTASPTSLPTFKTGNTPITIFSGNASSTNNRQAYWKVSQMWLE